MCYNGSDLGTGKTTIIKSIIELYKKESKKVVLCDISIEPIDADVIIVDEVSMIDLALMKYLLMGVYEGTKLVLVGDANQLPSVRTSEVF